MGREDVDAFLAECDDVLDDWEGSIDAASWSADGSQPIWPADTDEALDAALRAAVAAAWERVMVEFRATMAPLADALCGLSTTFVVFDEWLSRPLTGQAETVAAPEFVLPPEMWERATRRRPLLDVPPLALPDSLITHAVRWADPEQPDATPPNPRAGLEAQESPYPTRQRRRGR